MLKKIFCLVLSMAFSASMLTCFAVESAEVSPEENYANEAISVNGSSTPTLRDVSYEEQNGRQLLIKLYDVTADYNAEELAEADFEDGGLIYSFKDVIKVSDNTTLDKKEVSQIVTVSHEEKDGAMSLLQPMISYSQDGYSGQLTLQPDTIATTEDGTENYSYTVSDMREYANLDRNDTAYIPKSVQKNGVTLSLSGVDWQAMGNGTFTANASYSGRATGSRVTGYTSQALYSGQVSRETLDSVTYKVIYEGTPVPIPYLQYGVIVFVLLALIILFKVFWAKRKNAKIYALLDGEYRVVRRVRISYIDPIIDLTPAAVQSRSREYIILIDRFAARQLHNQRLRILCGDGMVREQIIYNTGVSYKIHLEAVNMPEEEEYAV